MARLGLGLGLGTAQFGLPYGVANRDGKIGRDDAQRILAAAADAGVTVVDTAPAYGDAERVLGTLLPAGHGFRIVTKTAVTAPGVPPVRGAARRSLLRSLDRLALPKVAGLLVHRAADLLAAGGAALFAELAALRDAGLVERIGVSVYDPADADALLERFPVEIVQLPANVFDQRALRTGLLDRLGERGVEVHVRSVFLQGLLLMHPDDAPAALPGAAARLAAFRARAAELGCTPVEAALGFAAALPGVAAIVCGVDRPAHLSELVAALPRRVDARGSAARAGQDGVSPDGVSPDGVSPDGAFADGAFADLAVADPAFLDPSRWPGRR